MFYCTLYVRVSLFNISYQYSKRNDERISQFELSPFCFGSLIITFNASALKFKATFRGVEKKSLRVCFQLSYSEMMTSLFYKVKSARCLKLEF